jgi:pyruvate dehydrogenase E1 component beta subunit
MERAFDALDAPIQRVAAADMPIPGGYVEQYVLPQPANIVAAIDAVMA